MEEDNIPTSGEVTQTTYTKVCTNCGKKGWTGGQFDKLEETQLPREDRLFILGGGVGLMCSGCVYQ